MHQVACGSGLLLPGGDSRSSPGGLYGHSFPRLASRSTHGPRLGWDYTWTPPCAPGPPAAQGPGAEHLESARPLRVSEPQNKPIRQLENGSRLLHSAFPIRGEACYIIRTNVCVFPPKLENPAQAGALFTSSSGLAGTKEVNVREKNCLSGLAPWPSPTFRGTSTGHNLLPPLCLWLWATWQLKDPGSLSSYPSQRDPGALAPSCGLSPKKGSQRATGLLAPPEERTRSFEPSA